MNTLNPVENVECSCCHKPNAIWDIGKCWACLDIEFNERFEENVMSGKVDKAIANLLKFIQALKLTKDFSTTNRRSFDEYLKQLQHL
jgi:hypothetical protein